VLVLSCGLFFSLGPFFYSRMVRRSVLFQDTQAFHLTHEFKSPLGAIQSAKEILTLELARPDPNPQRIQEYMEMIHRNTSRLEEFVGGILNVAKAESTDRALQKTAVSLPDLLLDIVQHFPGKSELVSIKVIDSTSISADPEAVRQVFTNLLGNAFNADPSGRIEIELNRVDERINVRISDHGVGIPADDLETIFQPFARSAHGRTPKSTGLGLAIAERWVKAHNGRIWAESDGGGKGATFVVELPIR
jgi:signal transduction histidine kinase